MSKRTTLTLDDDEATRLTAEVRRSGRPLRAVVNAVLRRGFDATPVSERQPFRVDAKPMGLRHGIDLDDAWGLLDRLDGPVRR